MNGNELLKRSIEFDQELEKQKKENYENLAWYPYDTLNNFIHLSSIFNKRPIDSLIGKHSTILDIGAGDGDLSFFLESLGYKSEIIDFGPTNYNGLKGARLLKEKRNSNVGIYEVDLDSQFRLPSKQYGLIFFLGILYHLKNPFYVMESLSKLTQYLIISTRVARFTPNGTSISQSSVAYLLAPNETNNDSTNYWIFSHAGLKKLLGRTGWNIEEIITVGDTATSNPSDDNHDERLFALIKSKFSK